MRFNIQDYSYIKPLHFFENNIPFIKPSSVIQILHIEIQAQKKKKKAKTKNTGVQIVKREITIMYKSITVLQVF